MLKYFTYSILFGYLSIIAQASAEMPPLVGHHGMVIFNHEGQWYASHMPLANSIHSHQVVFRFAFEELNRSHREWLELVNNQKTLVTLLPKVFDLQKLMHNSITHLTVDIYNGHFERGGKLQIESTRIIVEQVLLNRMMTSHSSGSYYVLPTSTHSGLLVHQIGAAPSFDQILPFTVNGNFKLSKLKLLKIGNSKPFNSNILKRPELTIGHQYYLESLDFK